MNLPPTLAWALAAALIATPAHAGLFDALTGGKDKGVDVDPTAPLTVAEHVKVKGNGRLAGVTRVAIPNFFVQFVRDQTIERSGRLANDSYTTQVRGLEPADLQALADGLHEGFVAELASTGIEVVPLEVLEANPEFQEIRKAARVSPNTEETSSGGMRDEHLQGVSLLVSARQLPINPRFTWDTYWLRPGASDGFKVSLVTAPMKLAGTLQVPILDVRYTVALSALKGTVRNSGTMYSQVQTTSFAFNADFFPRFAEGGTQVHLIRDGATMFSLARPVPIADLAATIEKGESGARGTGLLGALGRAIGGSADMAADAHITVTATDFNPKAIARGRAIARLMLEAMAK